MRDETIFAAALAISNPSRRSEYLDQACRGNPNLRRDVEALLAAHVADNPLDRANGCSPPLAATSLSDSKSTGTIIADRYKLLEQIGDGGMGTVWMAEQREPVKRLVAVKLIKPGMDSKAVLARFEAERQALAMMDHPHIAKVLDAGTGDDGRPFFVMELVKGLPLTEYCDTRRLPVNDRLDLFIQICSAVQHAHLKAVIHRDLKPSNVLVTEHDGLPVPKVIDFGLAKALGATNVLTERTLQRNQHDRRLQVHLQRRATGVRLNRRRKHRWPRHLQRPSCGLSRENKTSFELFLGPFATWKPAHWNLAVSCNS